MARQASPEPAEGLTWNGKTLRHSPHTLSQSKGVNTSYLVRVGISNHLDTQVVDMRSCLAKYLLRDPMSRFL